MLYIYIYIFCVCVSTCPCDCSNESMHTLHYLTLRYVTLHYDITLHALQFTRCITCISLHTLVYMSKDLLATRLCHESKFQGGLLVPFHPVSVLLWMVVAWSLNVAWNRFGAVHSRRGKLYIVQRCRNLSGAPALFICSV